MRWLKPVWLGVGATVALLVAAPQLVFSQCAMCRTALLNSPEGQALAAGFNSGILFLLGAPFVAIGTVAFLIVKARRLHTSRDRWARYPEASSPGDGRDHAANENWMEVGGAPIRRSDC